MKRDLMNPDPILDRSVGTTLEVSETPITLRLSAGSAIFTVRGDAWITQEGMAADIILGAGDRFDVPNRRALVISATKGRADLFVAEPSAARAHPMRNVYDFARSRAAQLQQEKSRELMRWLSQAFRTLAHRIRSALTFGPRATTH